MLYEVITLDFLSTDIDVFIGGGLKHFDDRKDGRVLTNELKDKGYEVFTTLKDAKNYSESPLAVLTAEEHNEKTAERGDMLVDATNKALDILKKDKDGFFLMVEGSQIDWGA